MLESTRKQLGLENLKVGDTVLGIFRLERYDPPRPLAVMASLRDLRNIAMWQPTFEVNGKKANVRSMVST